jgi:hypothetical protein
MRLVGAFFLAAGLAACSAAQPEPVPTDPQAWVDCRFRDGSWGHVRLTECNEAKGWARAPESGEVVPYDLVLEWQGREQPVRGMLMASSVGMTGPISIDLGEPHGVCKGSYRYTKTPHAVWEMTCEDGLSASGTYVHHGGRHVVAGFGSDSEGNDIGFEAWPAR